MGISSSSALPPTAVSGGRRALRKCPQCGGFLPWLGWKYFFLSTAAPGNGGPLLQPRGQAGVLYKVPPPPDRQPAGQRQRQRQGGGVEEGGGAEEGGPPGGSEQ